MKRLLIFCLIVLGLTTVYVSSKTDITHQDFDESQEVMPLGFDNSGSPKSIEDDWEG